MALDWTGIVVERDFYSEHYLKSVLEEDLRSVFARWTAAEQDSPIEAVARTAKEWTEAKEHGVIFYEHATFSSFSLKPRG